jgi:excinuclease UvrABC nuclease subunit
MTEAVKAERYEEAAELRDQLSALTKAMANPVSPAKREPDATAAPSPGGMPMLPKPAKKSRKPRQSKKSEE